MASRRWHHWLLLLSEPMPGHRFVTQLYLRLLGLTVAIAFVSLWTQVDGLMGAHGILPLQRTFGSPSTADSIGWWQAPTMFWWNQSDLFLHVLCALGTLCGLLVMGGLLVGPALLAAGIAYLSFVTPDVVLARFFGVQMWFLAYQWDALLIEATFLSLFVAPFGLRPRRWVPRRGGLWLLYWLLFRLMFASGVVKLAVFDPSQPASNVWRDFSALNYHFWTQPLPTVLGWHAAQLPGLLLAAMQFGMFAVELVLPFLLFWPGLMRGIAVIGTIALNLGIAATGNYGFFNLLTIALCLPLFGDSFFRFWLPKWIWQKIPSLAEAANRAGRSVQQTRSLAPRVGVARSIGFTLICCLVLAIGGAVFLDQMKRTIPRAKAQDGFWHHSASLLVHGLSIPSCLDRPLERVKSFRVANRYGLFAHMTTRRPEIVIEGSNDGETWLPYEFRYKPGKVTQRPAWCQPHMPRLDWNLWFEALRAERAGPSIWFQHFLIRVRDGKGDVLDLLEENPFPEAPPAHLRATLFYYEIPTPTERAERGAWWRRSKVRVISQL